MERNSLGKLGERIAATFLSSKGYQIIELNFYKRWGEIDIVAQNENVLVFVEVKTRMVNDRISPEEAMSPWKIESVKKTAYFYKNLHPKLPDALRIDFVGIVLDTNYKPIKINHQENIS